MPDSARAIRPVIEGDLARAINVLSAKYGESTVEYVRRILATAIAAEVSNDPEAGKVLDLLGIQVIQVSVMAA